MTAQEWGLLASLSILWGGSFLFTRLALEAFTPAATVLLRVALAAAALLAVAAFLRLDIPRDLRSCAGYLVTGLLNNALPFLLVAKAQLNLASSTVATLTATAPFFTLLLAHCLTDQERMTRLSAAGIGAGTIGVAFITRVDLNAEIAGISGAHTWCLLAAISYACAAVLGLRLRHSNASPITSAAGQLVAATALLLPITLVFKAPLIVASPTAAEWWAIIGLAMLSTALGYILYFRLLWTAGASNLLLVTFLIPVSASCFGIAFLGEALSFRDIIGFLIIASGLAAIDGRIFRRDMSK